MVTRSLCYVTIVGAARRSSASNSSCIAGGLLTYSSLIASCHDVTVVIFILRNVIQLISACSGPFQPGLYCVVTC